MGDSILAKAHYSLCLYCSSARGNAILTAPVAAASGVGTEDDEREVAGFDEEEDCRTRKQNEL